MISSTSCSSRRAVVALVGLAAACAHAPLPPPGPPLPRRIAVLPPHDATGAAASPAALVPEIRDRLAAAGFELAGDAAVEAFLARHRIRSTGGLARATSERLGAELEVDAALVTVLQAHGVAPPRLALSMRLVGVGGAPEILWIGDFARRGVDSRGLLGLGEAKDVAELERAAARALVGRLVPDAPAPARGGCGPEARFRPRHVFRATQGDVVGGRSIAVLPLVNRTSRRDAGDAVGVALVGALAAEGWRVVEPGLVREHLARFRVTMPNGISLDTAASVLDTLRVDLVVAGELRSFEEPVDGSAPPRVAFTLHVIEREGRRVIWQSRSEGAGDDGVFLFGVGTVRTAAGVACRMTATVAAALAGR